MDFTRVPLNAAIFIGAAVVFIASLALVRSQATADDVSCMRAMITHHSIAVLTNSRAHIGDPRVRKLADGIIEAQQREIGEMKALIGDLDRIQVTSHGRRATQSLLFQFTSGAFPREMPPS